jgi:hypothetical protein
MNLGDGKYRSEKAIVFSGYGSTGFSYHPVGRHGRSGIGVIGGDRLSNAAYTPYGLYGSATRESRNVLGL